MDLSTNLLTKSDLALPLIAFLVGLGGSLHCLTMCGPLVTMCASKNSQSLVYHIGRLLGYLLLVTLLHFFGNLIFKTTQSTLGWFSTITISLTFIITGIGLFKSLPVKVLYQRMWRFAFKFNEEHRAFLVGLLSVFLPCGLLYTVLISFVAIAPLPEALLATTLFWSGTLPALVFAQKLFLKVINPLVKKIPRLCGILLVSLGLIVLSIRAYPLLQGPVNTIKKCPHCH